LQITHAKPVRAGILIVFNAQLVLTLMEFALLALTDYSRIIQQTNADLVRLIVLNAHLRSIVSLVKVDISPSILVSHA
jgi:hypothetical protein